MKRTILLFLVLVSVQLNAVTPVNGQFRAHQACPAYLSIHSKSNPEPLFIQYNQDYVLREINHPSPNWLRIEIPGTSRSLRWVKAECGEFHYQLKDKKSCKSNPGLADSHVLALSWQPAFCETFGYERGKPECLNLSEQSHAYYHTTLHGLWPNQKACGRTYGYCGVKAQPNHCAYVPLQLSTSVARQLKQWMPSYDYGSCLERHEWYKHGSCQLLSSDRYFNLALRLAIEADESNLGNYIREHKGQLIKQTDLIESIRSAFGYDAAHKVHLSCKSGLLVDIFINLPALLPPDASLTELIEKAPESRQNNACPKTIKISHFTHRSG